MLIRNFTFKRLVLLAATLLFSFTAGGCDAPHAPTQDSSAPEISGQKESSSLPCFSEQLAGCYYYDSNVNGRITLELYYIDSMLIAEVEEEYASYYAAELLPDSPAVLSDQKTESAAFTVYAFSGFSNSGMYWAETPHIIISRTESGIRITEADNTDIYFKRDDAAEPIHTVEKYAELLPQTEEYSFPPEMCGVWTADCFGKYEIILNLQQEGILLWYIKENGEPVSVYFGAGSADPQVGTLTVIAERVGYAAMPHFFMLEYEQTNTGILLLKNTGIDGLLPMEGDIILTRKNNN